MRQQVDLFADGFAEPRVVLPLSQAAFVLGAVALCMALLHGLVAMQHHRAETRAATLAQRVTLQEAALAELRQVPAPSEDPQLAAKLEQGREMLARRMRLLQTLRERGIAPTAGFARYLRGLAGHPQEGLWLTRIRLRDGGATVSLEGRTVTAENVPVFLDRLRGAEAFQGARFEQLEMRAAQEGPLAPLRFELRAGEESGA